MSADVLTTPRLELRRFREDDAMALHAIFSDAQAMRYWSTLPHETLQQTQDFVARTIAACVSGDGDDFAVIHEDALIGKAGIWTGDELGFIFAPRVWGRGFASEAVAAVIARGFSRGRAAIVADVDPRNSRSLALLARLGFVKTGYAARTYHIGEEWTDSVYLERRAPS